MAQTILTVVAEVQPGSAALLRSRIEALTASEEATPNPGDQKYDHIRSAVPTLHFMSMTVAVADPGRQLADRRDELVDALKMQPAQERVVFAEVAGQRRHQLRDLRPHPGLGHLGQHLRVAFAVDQRGQHLPSRHTEDVGRHRRQLDPGVLEFLLQPLRLPAALGGLRGAVRCYSNQAGTFLASLPDPVESAVRQLDSGQVTSFMVGYCRDRNVESAKAMATSLRALLRFLHVSGHTPMGLAGAVPGVAG